MIRETMPVGVLQCNCTVLGDEVTREAVVIDPGADLPRILAAVAKHGLTVKQIVVTHAHIDHIAGALELKRMTGAPILYNQNDLPQLAMMDVQAGWVGMRTVPEVAAPDMDLADGQTVRIGAMAATVIHTPGHTQGSSCLYVADEQVLIAGDTLFAGGIGRTDFPGGDEGQILRSIQQKLMVLPDETLVVPGHGGVTTIGLEREMNPFL